ncbi:MAG: hypothetical protein IJJ26_00065 [Victivallales bacterium]|nr:hypothetical protein [Victivallales bacterium]
MIQEGRLPNQAEQALKQKALQAMREARWRMLQAHPFLGSLTMRLELHAVFDCRMTTACTDNTRLYADAEFFLAISPEEQLAILAHEVWHCAMRHLFRCGNRNHDRFNYAADLETDLLLQKDGFTVDLLPFDPAWDGHNAEWIYERIPDFLARFETKDLHVYPPQQQPGTSNFPSGDEPQSGEPQQPGEQQQPGDQQPGKKGGSPGEDRQPQESEGEGEELGGERTSPQASHLESHLPHIRHDPVFDPEFNLSFASQAGEEWESIAEQQASQCRRNGTLPGHFEQFLTPENKRTVDWHTVLLSFVTTMFGGERRWLPPNRRHVWHRLYLPGQERRKVLEVVVAVDTSGSTTDYLTHFLAELAALSGSFGEYKITVLQCDTDIRNVHEFTNDDPLPSEGFTFRGMGGTDLRTPFLYVSESFPEPPNVLIYLTDGGGPAPAEQPPYPVIWAITPDGAPPVPWGIHVFLPKDLSD